VEKTGEFYQGTIWKEVEVPPEEPDGPITKTWVSEEAQREKEWTYFEKRYMSVTELDHQICHDCFNERLTELNYKEPIISKYEQRAIDAEKKRRAAGKTRVQIDDKVYIIRKADFGKKNKKKKLIRGLKDEPEFEKFKKPGDPEYEYWICVEKPRRWIEYIDI